MACKIKVVDKKTGEEKVYSEKEFRDYLESSLTPKELGSIKAIATKAKKSADATGMKIGNFYVTEDRTNYFKDLVEKGIPAYATNTADAFILYKLVFGFGDKQAEFSAIIMDRMMKATEKAAHLDMDNKILEFQSKNTQYSAEQIKTSPFYTQMTPHQKGGFNRRLNGKNSASAIAEASAAINKDAVDAAIEEKMSFNPWALTSFVKAEVVSAREKARILNQDAEEKRSFKMPTQKEFIGNVAENLQAIKALPIEAVDGATFNLDGTKYDGEGLLIPVASLNVKASELTPQKMASFLAANKKKIGNNKFKIGLFKFEGQDQISIDINIVVDPKFEKQALAVARAAGQYSIYNIGAGEEVKTGQDGNNPVKYSDQEVINITDSLLKGDIHSDINQPESLLKGTEYEKDLTESKDGRNYVFFHTTNADEKSLYSEGVNSSKRHSTRTSRDEKQLQYGVASYYTKRTDGERMVTGKTHAVEVRKDKVYPIDTDPNGYRAAAEVKYPPNYPFRESWVKKEMTYLAKADGFEMIVARWNVGSGNNSLPNLRADATMTLFPAGNNYQAAPAKPINTISPEDFKNGILENELPIQISDTGVEIIERLSSMGKTALVVGGAVRDAMLGKNPKDIDIEVYGMNYEDLQKVLDEFGTTNLVGKSFGIIKFTDELGNEYDFSLPRKESKIGVGHKDFEVHVDASMTPKEAAARRDFTWNGLAYNPITKEIHDYYGGVKDLKDGILRHTSEQFGEDPLRILRAMQFQARMGMDIAPETIELMRGMVANGDLDNLSKERVSEEWMKWATKGVYPSKMLDFIHQIGLDEKLPFIATLKGTPQDPIWHPEGDVEIHTGHVMDAAAKIADREGLTGDDRAVLIFSALLHDFAKPPTTKTEMKDGVERITSRGHEQAGGPFAKEFLNTIGVKKSIIDKVVPIVENHLQHVNIASIQDVRGQDSATRKLAKRLGPATIDELLNLVEADASGRPPLAKGMPASGRILQEVSSRVGVEKGKQEDILMGRHLLDMGFSPGTEMGRILNKARVAQEDGLFTDIEGAKRWVEDGASLSVEAYSKPDISKQKGFKEFLQDTRLSDETRGVIEHLEKMFPKIAGNVKFYTDQATWDREVGSDLYRGYYATEDGMMVVLLNPKSFTDETVAHELIHAFTQVILDNPITAAEKAYVEQITSLWNDFKGLDSVAQTHEYIFNDVAEFITYAMTNTKFQEFLNSNEKTKTGFEKVIAAIKELFGFKDLTTVQKVIKSTQGIIYNTDYSDANSRIRRNESVDGKGERIGVDMRIDPDMPMSVSAVMSGKPTKKGKTIVKNDGAQLKNSKVAKMLQEAAIEFWGGEMVTSESITPEQEAIITKAAYDEVLYAISQSEDDSSNAFDWYTTAIEVALGIAGVIHPELLDIEVARQSPAFANEPDPVAAAQFVMRMALAITSQNLAVSDNTKYANEQFDYFKTYGKFDESRDHGAKAGAIKSNLKLANYFVAVKTPDKQNNKPGIMSMQEFEAFSRESFTVKQLSKVLKDKGVKANIAGYAEDTVNGSALFGPKIGQGFLQNLMGEYGPVTVDLWMRRTWGRWTGDVLGDGITDSRLNSFLSDTSMEQDFKDLTKAKDLVNGGNPVKLLPKLKKVEHGIVKPNENPKNKPTIGVSDSFLENIENDIDFRNEMNVYFTDVARIGDRLYKVIHDSKMTQTMRDDFVSGRVSYVQTSILLKELYAKDRATYDKYAKKERASKRVPIPFNKWHDDHLKKTGRESGLENDEISAKKPAWIRASKVIKDGLNPTDTPTNRDRQVITRIVNNVQSQLESQGHHVTNADIQALLWYPEKDIWAKLRGEAPEVDENGNPILDGNGNPIMTSSLKNSYDKEFKKIATNLGLGQAADDKEREIRGGTTRASVNDDGRSDGGIRTRDGGSIPKTTEGEGESVGSNPTISFQADDKKIEVDGNVNRVLSKLKKAFPNIKINMFDESGNVSGDSNENVSKYLLDKNGVVYGFVKDGEVFINSSKINSNTLVHEFSHIFTQILKTEYPGTHRNLIDRIKEDKTLMDNKRRNPNYSGLSDDALADEVLADLVGGKANALLDSKNTLHDKIRKLLGEFWNNVKNIFSAGSPNISGWTVDQFSKASISDIVNNITTDVLAGRILSRMSSEQIAKRVAVNENIQSILDRVADMFPSLAGLKITEGPSFQVGEFLDLNAKTNLYKKTFGENASRMIRKTMSIAFDDHEKLIPYLKKKIPMKGNIPFILDKMGDVVEREFLADDDSSDKDGSSSPFDLLREAGYEMTKTDSASSVESFKAYYQGEGSDGRNGGSVICTYNDVSGRLKDNLIMFVVREDASETLRAEVLTQENLSQSWKEYLESIGRKNEDGTYNLNGLKNNREDPFSTSVLSIQINKNNGYLKMISRYNHSIQEGSSNPDATFNNDLNKLANGLDESLYNYVGVSKTSNNSSRLPEGIVRDAYGNLYKYSKEVNGVYYGDGFYIRNGEAVILDPNTERMVMGFVVNSNGSVTKIASDDHFIFGDVNKVTFLGGNKMRLDTKEFGIVEFDTEDGLIKQGVVMDEAHKLNYLKANYNATVDVNGNYTINGINSRDEYIHIVWSDKITMITGSALLRGTNLTNLGNVKEIWGELDIETAKLTSLGKVENVWGDIQMTGNTNLKSFGELKRVGGSVFLDNSKIKSLGKIENIEKSLYLNDSEVEDLGELTSIGKSIFFTGSRVTSTGKLKTIGSQVDFSGSQVSSIEGIEYIGGKAWFNGSNITSLSTLRHIEGDAFFRNSMVNDLGELTHIGGDFSRPPDLKSIGKLKYIDGGADFEDSQVKSLGGLRVIGKSANFVGSKITDLGELRRIGNSASFARSSITSLGKLNYIGQSLNLSGSNVMDLGELTEIPRDASFRDTNIKSLGAIKIIGGDADFSNSKITDLGELTAIEGSASFNNSKLKSLGKLDHIGKGAYFDHSKVKSLGVLQWIGGNFKSLDSELTDLGELKQISGSAYFEGSKIEDLKNLEAIGGIGFFSDSNITNLGKLKTIVGHAYFNRSEIKSLGNLKEIMGDAVFNGSEVNDIGDLRSIGRHADFSNSEVTDLKGLIRIGGDLDISGSKIESLGDLTSVGGNAAFNISELKSLGSLERIEGNANFMMSNVTDLGNLNKVGGTGYFMNSKISSIGDVKFGKVEGLGGKSSSDSTILNQNNDDSILGKPQDKPHGAVQLFANGRAIIYALTNPNVSTPVHELAHVFEQYLTEDEKKKLHAFAEKVNNRKLDPTDPNDKVAVSEAFARGFERFLANGEIDDPELKPIFEKFKEWLTQIYRGITNSSIDLNLNDDMNRIYSKMLGVESEMSPIKTDNKVKSEAAAKVAADLLGSPNVDLNPNDRDDIVIYGADEVTDEIVNEWMSEEGDGEDNDIIGSIKSGAQKTSTTADPNVLMQDSETVTDPEERERNTEAFKDKIKKLVMSGKVNARKFAYVVTAIKNMNTDMKELNRLLGVPEDFDLSQSDTLNQWFSEYMNETVSDVKSPKWVGGKLIEDRKTISITRIEYAASIRKDNKFDALLKSINSPTGTLKNDGTDNDVTAEILFMSKHRRELFASVGITKSELAEFLGRNKKDGVITAYSDVMDKLGKRTVKDENGNIVLFKGTHDPVEREDKSGNIVTVDRGHDVFGLASRYMYAHLELPEIKAWLIQGLTPKNVQPNAMAQFFVSKLLESLERASNEVADEKAKSAGKRSATAVEKAVQFKATLREMATMPKVLEMLQVMSAGDGVDAASAIESISKMAHSGASNIDIENRYTNAPNGIELLLLMKIVDKQTDLGDASGAASTIKLVDNLAVQYGRAIQLLTTANSVRVSDGRLLSSVITRRQADRMNAIAAGKPIPGSDGETFEGAVDRIVNEIEVDIEESKVDMSDAIDDEFDKFSTTSDEKIAKAKEDLVKKAIELYDDMTDSERQEFIDAIEGMDATTLMQGDSEKQLSAAENLTKKIFEDIVKERLERGFGTDLNDETIKQQVINKYAETVREVMKQVGAQSDTKKLAAYLRKVFGVTLSPNDVIDSEHSGLTNTLFGSNKKSLEDIVEKARLEAREELISAVSSVGSSDRSVAKTHLISRIKNLILKGNSSKEKLDKERQGLSNPSSDKKKSKFPDKFAAFMADSGDLLYNLIARSAELGLDTNKSAVRNAPYAVFTKSNLIALAKTKFNGSSGQELIDSMSNYLNSYIDDIQVSHLNDPMQSGNPHRDVIASNVADAMRAAMEDAMALISMQEADKAEKIAVRTKDKADKEEATRLKREAEKEVSRLTKIKDVAEAAKKLAKDVDDKANMRGADTLIAELAKASDTKNVVADFAAGVTDSSYVKSLMEKDRKTLTPDELSEIAAYIQGRDDMSQKDRRVVINAMNAEYNKSRNEARKNNTSLNNLLSSTRKDAEEKKKKNQKQESIKASETAILINKLLNGDLSTISTKDIAIIRAYIDNQPISDGEKDALNSAIDSIEKGSTDAIKADVLDHFARILVDVRHSSSSPTTSTRESMRDSIATLRDALANDEVSISDIMDARLRLKSELGVDNAEKIAMLDDMLSKILGRSIGKTTVRQAVKEMLSSANADDIKKGKVKLADLIKQFYNNEGNKTGMRQSIEQYIIENTGITDPEVVVEIKKAFDDAFDKVWTEEKLSAFNKKVNDQLRTNLTKATKNREEIEAKIESLNATIEQKRAAGEDVKNEQADLNELNKQLDKAMSNERASKKHYEQILRKAPQKAALAAAIRAGMHTNEDFKHKLLQVFGIESFSQEDEHAMQEASRLIASEDEATQKRGFNMMNAILKKHRKNKSFFQAYGMNDMYKMNILSGINTVIKSGIGAIQTRYLVSIQPIAYKFASHMVENLASIIGPGKTELNLEISKLVAKNITDTIISLMPGAMRFTDIMLRGETESVTIDELAKQLVHSDEKIADWVAREQVHNPVSFISMMIRSAVNKDGSLAENATKERIIMALGLEEADRIELANKMDSVEAIFRRNMINNMTSTDNAFVKNVKKVLLKLGYSFEVVTKAMKELIRTVNEDLDSKGYNNVQKAGAWGFYAMKQVAADITRVVMISTVVNNRALAAVDITNNTIFNNASRNTMAVFEAEKLVNEYSKKSKDVIGLAKHVNEFLDENPGISSLALANEIAAQPNVSKDDATLIQDIAKSSDTNLYPDDYSKIESIVDIIEGKTNAHQLMGDSLQHFNDSDKSIVSNLLAGKDDKGDPIIENGKPISKIRRMQYVDAYISGRGVTGNGWYDDVKEIILNRNPDGTPGAVKTSIPQRLMNYQQKRENTFNPSLQTALSEYAGDFNYTSNVQGVTGYYQRMLSNITNAAQGRINRAKAIEGKDFNAFNQEHLKDYAKIALMNLFLALPRAAAHSFMWARMSMPTALIQRRLMEVKNEETGETYLDYYLEEGMKEKTFFGIPYLYTKAQWDDTDTVWDKAKYIAYANTIGKAKTYQWRKERRTVAGFKNGKWEIENRRLTELERESNNAKVALYTASTAVLYMLVDKMMCKDKEGNTLIKGDPRCAECQDGNSPDGCKQKFRITGNGYRKQGDKYEPNSVQWLTTVDELDRDGNPTGNKIEEWTGFKYDYNTTMYTIFAPFGYYYERVKSNSDNGVKNLPHEDMYDAAAEAAKSLYVGLMASTGVTQASENILRILSEINNTAKDDTDKNEDSESLKQDKEWRKIMDPLSKFLPGMGQSNNEMRANWGGSTVNEQDLGDMLMNKNYWLYKAFGDKERTYQFNPDGTGVNKKSGLFTLNNYQRQKEAYEEVLREQPGNTELLAEMKNRLDMSSTDFSYNKLVNSDHIAAMTFTKPNIGNLVSSFERGTMSGKSFTQYCDNIQNLPVKVLDRINELSSVYKKQYLMDRTKYPVKSEAGLDDKSIIEIVNLMDDQHKAQYFQDINRYANSRAIFETIFDIMIKSNVLDKVPDGVIKGIDGEPAEININTPGFEDQLKEMMIRMSFSKPFSEDLYSPSGYDQKKLTVPKGGDYPNYPVYSNSSLVKFMAFNGIKLDGGSFAKHYDPRGDKRKAEDLFKIIKPIEFDDAVRADEEIQRAIDNADKAKEAEDAAKGN